MFWLTDGTVETKKTDLAESVGCIGGDVVFVEATGPSRLGTFDAVIPGVAFLVG